MEPAVASSLLTDDDNLEILLAASNFTVGTIARDRSCRVTHDVDGIEAAHICPVEEKTWFFENEMNLYNLNDILSPHIAMNDISNAVALRADLHKIFDDKKFVFVPKAGRWVTHFLRQTHNVGSRVHNVPVELTPLVSVNFLLTRFTWAVLPLVAGFVSAGVPRKLRLRQGNGDGPEDEAKTKKVTEAVRMVVREMNSSPEKRKLDGSNPTGAGPMNSLVSAEETSSIGRTRSPEKEKAEDLSFPSFRLTDYEESDSSSVTPLSEYDPHGCLTMSSSRGPAEVLFFKEQEQDKIHPTPMFPTINTLSPLDTILSQQTSSQVSSPNEIGVEASHFDSLRQEWVPKQRPLDQKLYCCNYNDVESAMAIDSGGDKKLRSGRLSIVPGMGVQG